eukprot:TRINITY_DN13183_c1_g2_i4.p1 TRINITY_DN13183_c1_g2~~TRINITY_DN13183_c1_g2_i4.p1  ORF type:complete len:555 (+),score=60.81 TRINITY_DN13183_c1_g2_i4:163-1827(+)
MLNQFNYFMTFQHQLNLQLKVVLYGFRLLDRIKLSHIPGPAPTWLVGSLFNFNKKGFLTTLVQTYGPVTKLFFGGRPTVLIGSPEIAKGVLEAFEDREQLREMVTNPQQLVAFERAMLPFATGSLAQRLRNSWIQVLHTKTLQGYESLMFKSAQDLVDVVNVKMEQGEILDIHNLANRMSLNIVGTTAFGLNFDLLKEQQIDEDRLKRNGGEQAPESEDTLDQQKVQNMVEAAVAYFSFGMDDVEVKQQRQNKKTWTLSTPWFLLNLLIPEFNGLWQFCNSIFPSQRQQKMQNFLDVGRNVAKELVQRARKHLENQQTQVTQQGEIISGSFLESLIASQNIDQTRNANLQDFELAAQAWAFILAGSETTANAISLAVYCLATNPDSEQKLLSEIDSVNPNTDNEYDFHQIQQLRYLECVIKETLRLYPPTPLINRRVDENRMIDKYLIPRGTTLVVSLYAMHRNPKYWERPDDFYPERFLENEEFPAYMPFGGGSRMCLGSQFAMQEAKIALFALYKRFSFKLTAGQVPLRTRETITSSSPVDGIHFTAHLRIY